MTQWIAAITRGHNASVCLLKDGEIVLHIEEERLTREKYDGAPLVALTKVKEYTDKLDYLVLAHTQEITSQNARLEYTTEDPYTGLARKLGLIENNRAFRSKHPQVIDYGLVHHKLHASCAFYRSGFDSAVAVIVDGAGSFLDMNVNNERVRFYEVESIFGCDYPSEGKGITALYKHLGGNGPAATAIEPAMPLQAIDPDDNGKPFTIIDASSGIVKAYEAVTMYCGWDAIEAGKTMGLSPYGQPNDKIPPVFSDHGTDEYRAVNGNLFKTYYPNASYLDELAHEELRTTVDIDREDWTRLQNRRDMAYAVQTESQERVLHLIRNAVKTTNNPNVVLSGGYGLNCVANYYFLKELEDEGINLYVEPLSSDAGTSVGAALFHYHKVSGDTTIKDYSSLYLGPEYNYTLNDLESVCKKYKGEITDTNHKDVVNLITDKNIVALFQGRSEAGPRALGSRSIFMSPTRAENKDILNERVKHRDHWRPFAGAILEDRVGEYFLEAYTSPYMLYSQHSTTDEIPAITHEDRTCRIQTVNKDQNPRVHDLLTRLDPPVILNTSFNDNGEPIIESPYDAVRAFRHLDIDHMVIGDFIVDK